MTAHEYHALYCKCGGASQRDVDPVTREVPTVEILAAMQTSEAQRLKEGEQA